MFGVISFPGTNCETETKRALNDNGISAEIFRWNEKEEILKNLNGYVIAGGFSFEDRGRSGVIASTYPIIEILREASIDGKVIIGICNGAQVLVESGLVTDSIGPRISLFENKRIDKNGKLIGTGYYNTWTYLSPNKNSGVNIFNNFESLINIPLAHGEGRFLIPKEEYENIDIVFKYVDEYGNIDQFFPTNPNGSDQNIAAITNKRGNVLAIMPHPERSENGYLVFQSLKKYLDKGEFNKIEKDKIKSSKKIIFENKKNFDIEIYVKLLINDNELVTIENALKNNYKDLEINLDKYKFIGIKEINEQELIKIEELIFFGEFANFEKETLVIKYKNKFFKYGKGNKKIEIDNFLPNGILVRNFDDIDSLSLNQLFKKSNLNLDISTGKYWAYRNKEVLDKISNSYIFANPVSQFIEK